MKTFYVGFAVALVSGISSAESDYNLEQAVMKNLKWIRPPTWDHMPDDMDSFFSQDPQKTPEFALKTEQPDDYVSDDAHQSQHYDQQQQQQIQDQEQIHTENGEENHGEYYDEATDHRYVFPAEFDFLNDRARHYPNFDKNDHTSVTNDPRETYYRGRKYPAHLEEYDLDHPQHGMYDAAPRSLYRETPEDKEAREHYEFGMMYGASPPAPFYGTEP